MHNIHLYYAASLKSKDKRSASLISKDIISLNRYFWNIVWNLAMNGIRSHYMRSLLNAKINVEKWEIKNCTLKLLIKRIAQGNKKEQYNATLKPGRTGWLLRKNMEFYATTTIFSRTGSLGCSFGFVHPLMISTSVPTFLQ